MKKYIFLFYYFKKNLYICVMKKIKDENIEDGSSVIALKNVDSHGKILIIKNKEYEVYTSFYTDKMASGFGLVIYCEDGEFHTIDSDYFISRFQYDLQNFNI